MLDSRGNPTIEVEVEVRDRIGRLRGVGRAAAPSGASRGKHEVQAFPRAGVEEAVRRVKKLVARRLVEKDPTDQRGIDALLWEVDGTPNLREIGGNSAVAISMAVAKAAAVARGKPLYRYLGEGEPRLPYPLGNVLGGGAHAGGEAPDIQEFLCLPMGARSFLDAAFANARVHKRVGEILRSQDPSFTKGKGDEGAWAPRLGNLEALEVVAKACEEVGEEVGFELRPALDLAASGLYDTRRRAYVYSKEERALDPGEQVDFVAGLIKEFRLVYVEDPIREDDFASFAELTRKVGKRCLICGDDLFVTNPARIRRGIELGAANAVLVKPNQVGTLSDAREACELAKRAGWVPVMSHRSGETADETIAHLAVAFGCPVIKTGAVGGERIAKLNELIRIEEELGAEARMGELPF